MTQLKTHPELSKCLRPQTDTERSKLTASIAADGVRDPIIEWDGYILDGHNRIEVARKLGKDYKTIKMEFADIYAAKQWMRDNQRARRNLEAIELVRLLQSEADDLAAKAKERMIEGAKGVENLPHLGKTRDKMGDEIGVSGRTYASLSKVVKDGSEELQIAVREKQIGAEAAAKITRNVGSVKPAEVKKPDTTAADTLFAKQEAERKQAEYEAQVAAEAKRAELAAERQRELLEEIKAQKAENIRKAKKQVSEAKKDDKNLFRTQYTGENEWYTPSDILEKCREISGGFDLDPASCEKANERVKAASYFTQEQDGLSQEWSGRVWMNPPYSRDLIGDFCEKIATENVDEFFVLVNNSTDTKWFRTLCRASDMIAFPSARVKFHKFGGEESASPTNGHAIFYSGKNRDKFAESFAADGLVVSVIGCCNG